MQLDEELKFDKTTPETGCLVGVDVLSHVLSHVSCVTTVDTRTCTNESAVTQEADDVGCWGVYNNYFFSCPCCTSWTLVFVPV